MKVIGIMSGTSVDGIDMVLADVSGSNLKNLKVKFIDSAYSKYPKKLRDKILQASENKLDFREVADLDFEIGDEYFKALKKCLNKKKWKFDLIGLHGQTIYHNPPRSTVQIGKPNKLESFGKPVVNDFRSKSLAFGGQGAPLASFFHKVAFEKQKNKAWAYLNIGGMSNITVFNLKQKWKTTDLGPGNVYSDFASNHFLNKPYDKGGRLALKGIPDIKTVKTYISSHKYTRKSYPNSCGREDFSEKSFKKLLQKMNKLRPEDAMASFCEISVQYILKGISSKIENLIVGGGGVYNNYFINRLKYERPNTKVISSQDFGWSPESVEGGAFALLAYMKLKKIPYPKEFLKDNGPLIPLGRM